MKTTTPNIVLLGVPRDTPVPKLIVRITGIANAISANKAMFPSPTPTLVQVESDVTTLTNAETALRDRIGTRVARDTARAAVLADATSLHTYVQSLVNANPSQAETIATSASMTLRKAASRNKPDLAVHQTVSGVVHVVAKATQGAKANDWQYSTDGGKTWIDVPSTTKAMTTITGLQPGTTVSYRHRVLTKTGHGDWTLPLAAMVT